MAKTKLISEAADRAEESQARMSFGEHLDELRKRIIAALVGSVAGVTLCIVYYKAIIAFVSRPYILVAQQHHLPNVFITLKPQEAFLTSITLAFQAGLILSSPWIIFQIWKFVASGLFERERRVVYRYTAPSAVLFLIGVAFFYFIVLPMTLNFFMGFTADTVGAPPTANWLENLLLKGGKDEEKPLATQPGSQPGTQAGTQAATRAGTQSVETMGASSQATTQVSGGGMPISLPVLTEDPAVPPGGQAYLYVDGRDGHVKIRTVEGILDLTVTQDGALFTTNWRYDDYLSFVMFTALLFGLAFELPMVIMILAQVGIVEVKTFRKIRKYAYFAIVGASVIAAPSGDLMTLAFLTVPLIFLYEVGIVVAAIVVRRRDAAAATA